MKAQTSANFDRVARLYRWAEYLALGPLLQRARNWFVPALPDRRRALLLGDGDGRFTAALLRAHPATLAHAVDGSGAMLRLLRGRCAQDGNLARLGTEQASVLAVRPSPATDLIVTHFLLDCLSQTELEQLARHLAAAVRPGCRWLLSEFGLPRHRFWRASARLYIRLLYVGFRVFTGLAVTSLPDPQRGLHQAGFHRLARRQWLGGFLYTELWELAAEGPGGTPRATQLRQGTGHQPKGEC